MHGFNVQLGSPPPHKWESTYGWEALAVGDQLKRDRPSTIISNCTWILHHHIHLPMETPPSPPAHITTDPCARCSHIQRHSVLIQKLQYFNHFNIIITHICFLVYILAACIRLPAQAGCMHQATSSGCLHASGYQHRLAACIRLLAQTGCMHQATSSCWLHASGSTSSGWLHASGY